jgi:hypothetical protein
VSGPTPMTDPEAPVKRRQQEIFSAAASITALAPGQRGRFRQAPSRQKMPNVVFGEMVDDGHRDLPK